MTITVEDGTGVADANSYLTVTEVRNFARFRGVELPVTDLDVEILINQAVDELELRSDQYVGEKTYPDVQGLSWPRTYCGVDQGIPERLKAAQCYYVIAIRQGVVLRPTLGVASTGGVKREKMDVIEVEYFESVTASAPPKVTSAELALAPLLRGYIPPGGPSLRTVRA